MEIARKVEEKLGSDHFFDYVDPASGILVKKLIVI